MASSLGVDGKRVNDIGVVETKPASHNIRGDIMSLMKGEAEKPKPVIKPKVPEN